MESTTIAFQDIAYQIDFKTNSPIVHIFGRNTLDRTPTHTILTNCEPYFYVPESEVDRLNGCPELDIEPLDGCRPGESYTDIFGRPVRRIYTDLPGRVAKVRDRFSFTDESDILFERRVIVDKKIRSGFTEDIGIITPITIDYVPPRILFFDIEVRAPRGVMPSAQTVKYPISTIQIKDSYTGKKFVITCGVQSKQRDTHIPADSETELYEIFYQLLKKIDPDILTGWYCLPEYTRVFTKNGFKQISTIKEGELLHDGSSVKQVVNTGNKKILSINTKFGWSIKSSEDHQFLVRSIPHDRNYVWKHVSGYDTVWKKANELTENDMICCPIGEGLKNNGNNYNLKDLYLMGFVYGDGTLSDKYTYMLYNKDKSLIEFLKDKDKSMWYSHNVWCTKKVRRHYSEVEHLIVNEHGKKSLNICGLSKLSIEEFCAFLAGWYDSDGSFWDNDMFSISDCSRSNQDINKLFLHFGMISSFYSTGIYNIICADESIWDNIRNHSYYPDSIKNRPLKHRCATNKDHFKYAFTKDFSQICIGIKSVVDTGNIETCYDIETSSHQFNIGCIVHNCNQFDLPYLIRRATALGISTKGLCRINDVRCDLMPNKKYIVKVPGRQCFDMLDGFKKLKGSESEREDYGLKTISAEYGFPYKDYGAYIDEIYTNEDWSTLLNYCENDVDSLSIIEKETEMFQFFESVRYITGCKLEDTLHNSRIIETFLMHEGIAPMPRKRKVEGDPYEGAFVLEPPIGIHEHVGWVDLAALYPTIMRAFNLSPDKEKIVPRVLTFIVEERERLRAINKSPAKTKNTEYQEMVMKYLANSFYGVLGSKDFRLYNEEIASKVTEYGRIISERVRDECIRLGYTPVYGDTDSVAVTSVLSVNEGIILQNSLNSMLKQWSLENNALVMFSLKFEKLHRSLLFKPDRTGKKAAKKRYAGKLIWSDKDGDCNKLNYTGIELKRSDQSKLTKQLLREFLEITLIEGDIEKGMTHVRNTYRRVKAGKISIYDLSIPKGVYSDREDPWVRGKHTAEHDYGHIFDPSVKMRLVYLKPREGKPVEVCIDDEFDLSKISNLIDWNLHAEKSIENKLESYMEALGYSWRYVIDGQQILPWVANCEEAQKVQRKSKRRSTKKKKG